MSEDEKKAIDYYENNEYSFGFEADFNIENFKKAIGIEETDEDTFERHQIRFKTLLNLIEKQQKELEKKDHIIDLMAEKICFFDIDLLASFDNEIQCVKYFTKKVDEQNG